MFGSGVGIRIAAPTTVMFLQTTTRMGLTRDRIVSAEVSLGVMAPRTLDGAYRGWHAAMPVIQQAGSIRQRGSAACAGFNSLLSPSYPLSDAAPAFPASAPESDTVRPGCADGRETPDATMNSPAHDAPAGHAEAQARRAVSLSKQAPPKVTQPVPAVITVARTSILPKSR